MIQIYAQFWIFRKGSGNSFFTTFFRWFFLKIVSHVISYYLTKDIGNMCVAIVFFPGCDFINFETNLNFLIKPFFYRSKKSRQNFKYLENEKSFWGETKGIFINFRELSITKNCLRHENVPLELVKLSCKFT